VDIERIVLVIGMWSYTETGGERRRVASSSNGEKNRNRVKRGKQKRL